MSPPLTLGLTGRLVAWTHRAPLVFNIQDVFPDAAVETGAITNRRVIAVASWLERVSYRAADAVTVLSDDLRGQRRRQAAGRGAPAPCTRSRTSSTPTRIAPGDRMTPYRRELGIGAEPVVLYAGNIGYSQSVELLLGGRPGAARRDVPRQRRGRRARRARSEPPPGWPTCASPATCPRSGSPSCWRPATSTPSRCERGLAAVSVPSKTYSILAAGRPSSPPSTRAPRSRACSPRPAAGSPSRPTTRRRSSPPCAALVDDPAEARGDGPARPGRGSSPPRRRQPSPRRTRRSSARCGRPAVRLRSRRGTLDRTGSCLMHAVVLVGGFGTRLRPLTNTVPKSMLPIAHVPLLVRLIGQLERGRRRPRHAGPRLPARAVRRRLPRRSLRRRDARLRDRARAARHGRRHPLRRRPRRHRRDVRRRQRRRAHRPVDRRPRRHPPRRRRRGDDPPHRCRRPVGVRRRRARARRAASCASSRSRRPAPSRAT